jgi:polyprenyl P-hydroxybenzoate/phenylacrylic acid decarboxylase-like protein
VTPETSPRQPRVVVGLAAAEALEYGRCLLQTLGELGVERHLVVGGGASRKLGAGASDVRALAEQVYAEGNQAARISSGSFLTRGMIVAPCDAGSVATIVLGLAPTLVYRAADVTLKEGRPLVLGVPADALERVPDDIRARAADVPGLMLLPLAGPERPAVATLLAQLGLEGAFVAA